MAARHQLIKARLGILAMAKELQNVVRTCKLVGISRSQFYTIRKAYELHGERGLVPQDRRKPRMPNRTPDQIEGQILLKTREHPTVSYLRLAERMKDEGIGATPAMVRYVWLRHGLSKRLARLHWVRKQNGAGNDHSTRRSHLAAGNQGRSRGGYSVQSEANVRQSLTK